jgi:putative sugar O-methyltransferase
MENKQLRNLLDAYKKSDGFFQATSYWASYEESILKVISNIDFSEIRSGKYPILATFGFNDVIYTYHTKVPFHINLALKFIHNFIIKSRSILPYAVGIPSLRQIAFDNCQLSGELSKAIPIDSLSMSTFGNPSDVFEFSGNFYSMAFLDYYLRYCFVHKNMQFKGDEIIVELGSGSGYQIEILKKIYPNITILCFDLPAQLYLCETYLTEALGQDNIVGTTETLEWADLSGIKKGAVHFFGSWQFPLVRKLEIDLFWNAASFGEMEPDVVKNYLDHVVNNAKWIYLLQARYGKETEGKIHVKDKVTFDDYSKYLENYVPTEVRGARKALGHLPGYFEAIWKKA